MMPVPPYNKYANKRTMVDNILFASKKEAARYIELRALLYAGCIRFLEMQPLYEMRVNGIKICTYRADFRYAYQDGVVVVEDTKGKKTDVYQLKKKLLKACHGITIHES